VNTDSAGENLTVVPGARVRDSARSSAIPRAFLTWTTGAAVDGGAAAGKGPHFLFSREKQCGI